MFFSFKWNYTIHILLHLGYFSQYFWDECFLLCRSVIHLFSFLYYRSQPDTHIWLCGPQGLCLFNSAVVMWTRPQMICCSCCSAAQLCPTLCDPMNCSTPGFPVLHHLLELAQTHVHWVSDALQPSHPLSSPFPPALNLSQHRAVLHEVLIWACPQFFHIFWPF